MNIESKLATLPKSSGVYLMLNDSKSIIYIGKAKNLFNRINQYFSKSVKELKTKLLVDEIADVEYVVTNSELEALILENNLIKLHKPFYNILLKDDKTYPYLKIHVNEKYPYLEIVRKVIPDGNLYFGPYMQGITATALYDLIHYVYPVRTCKGRLNKNKQRACLRSFLNLCSAPCVNQIEPKEYNNYIQKIIAFLKGDDSEVRKHLKDKIERYAIENDFESAIKYRDYLNMLDNLKRDQIVELNYDKNFDVFTILAVDNVASINVLNFRAGHLLNVENIAKKNIAVPLDEILSTFLMQYYHANPILAQEILINHSIDFKEEIESFLSSKKGKSIRILLPKRGMKKDIINLSIKNANEYINKYIHNQKHKINAVSLLKEELKLSRYPQRIECFDVSNLGAKDKVGSMAVFIDGVASKNHYRKFKIKYVDKIDDYSSMKEILRRRVENLDSMDVSFSNIPDLIVIDGGRGHLNKVLEEINGLPIDIIALAEKTNYIYKKDCPEPIILDKSSPALFLLQRIRDESHRFALDFQVRVRSKKSLYSQLENIHSIGKENAKALMEHFKTIEAIKGASIEDLARVKGIGKKKAGSIFSFFNNQNARR